MNARERFIRSLTFKDVDRVFLMNPSFWNATIDRWRREGLPLGMSAQDYFSFDEWELIPIDFGPIPRFVTKVHQETDAYRVETDELGIRKKVIIGSESMPQYLDFPVKGRDDFEAMKSRYDPDDMRRLPKSWSGKLFEHYEELDHPWGIGDWPYFGAYSQARWFMGPEGIMVAFHRDPDLVRDIFEFLVDFQIRTAGKVLREVRPVYLGIFEDVAYNAGPLISPRLFREFLVPCYRRLIDFFKGNGVGIVLYDSDGDIRPLVPDLISSGVTCIWPLEAAANMDAVALREEYGEKVALLGNIDKRALIAGGAAIEREMRKVDALAKGGGYIPCVDHAVPPDVPFDNFVEYVRALKRYSWPTNS